jgi:hypothetical protein
VDRSAGLVDIEAVRAEHAQEEREQEGDQARLAAYRLIKMIGPALRIFN